MKLLRGLIDITDIDSSLGGDRSKVLIRDCAQEGNMGQQNCEKYTVHIRIISRFTGLKP